MPERFHVAPAMRSQAPSRWLPSLAEALAYARRAATQFRLSYSVFAVANGWPRHVCTIHPDTVEV